MQRSHFRALVAAYAVSNVLGGVLLTRTRDQLPQPLRPFADPAIAAQPPALAWTSVILVGLAVVSVIGLLAFWRPARELFLAYVALVILVGPFAPPLVQPALAGTVLTLAAMLAGAVVAVLLFSSIGDEFRRSRATG